MYSREVKHVTFENIKCLVKFVSLKSLFCRFLKIWSNEFSFEVHCKILFEVYDTKTI